MLTDADGCSNTRLSGMQKKLIVAIIKGFKDLHDDLGTHLLAHYYHTSVLLLCTSYYVCVLIGPVPVTLLSML
jgi:hypothetical protein